MKLSVIIVNYNVKYFIEQCLHSVYKALTGIEGEVIVVDNNSVDGSCEMIQEKFPQATLIANKKNVGFSKANNQGIHISKGQYVLLLNPDTVVQEDTFSSCIDFMDAHPEAGALGIKMIDGKGNFLPESKRALPTPAVAFYKIFGLSAFFPKSRIFGRYHLGYLDKDQTHEVEILSGAYMFMRREALDKSGLLDETFFMYGEDVDLSYRIIKAGYKNYYFAGTTIIHYKGESTKKGSLNYVLVFYDAMLIFAEKHFSKNNLRAFSLLIKLAIYLRAGLSILKRFVNSVIVPFADILIIFSGYLFLLPWWEGVQNMDYPDRLLYLIIPCYIIMWIVTLLFSGAYEKPVKISNIAKGVGVGTLIILAIYGLLPLDMRFSRALIILGAVWSFFSLSAFRFLLHLLKFKQFRLGNIDKKRIVIIGDNGEYKRVSNLLSQTHISPEVLGFISGNDKTNPECLGNLEQLEDIITIYNVDEIVFCAKDMPAASIIDNMLRLSHIDIEYKIAPPESLSVVGSSSINTAGDLYLINLNTINKPSNRRNKRIVDVLSAVSMFIMFPVLVFLLKRPLSALRNIFRVLSGKYTWVGYYSYAEGDLKELPKIKKGVLSPVDGLAKKNISDDLKVKLNVLYAKDYKFLNDVNIILRGLLKIDA